MNQIEQKVDRLARLDLGAKLDQVAEEVISSVHRHDFTIVTSDMPAEYSPTFVAPIQAESPIPTTATSQFTGDGRTHCSQMTSCAEAIYYIEHCPDTKMDGNNDGEPCEKQWCN